MARLIFSSRLVCLLLSAILMFAGAASFCQQNPKRLILKDGSYQTATQWAIRGDRVRYYSAERYAWEEVPNDLVDWPATEKYNRERDAERAASVQQITKSEDAAGEPPLAAPGLRLPDGGGVFLLDTYQNQPQLVELSQNGGQLNRHAGRNILRAAINPLALSSKQTIELQGARAKVQSHATQPVIYIDVDSDGSSKVPQTRPSGGAPASQGYGIVRFQKKKDLRVVGNLNVAVYGKVSQKENWIKTTTTAMGEWMKVVPDQPLTAGEYAVVELLGKGQINLYVWDFGVDPSAPANPNAWTPRHSAQGAEGKPPGLEKRPFL